IGRVFWRGAIAQLSGDGDVDEALDALLLRDFVQRETRSSISGEHAFRFKHILIREIAYSGLTKSDRAELHAAFAEWLHGRGADGWGGVGRTSWWRSAPIPSTAQRSCLPSSRAPRRRSSPPRPPPRSRPRASARWRARRTAPVVIC